MGFDRMGINVGGCHQFACCGAGALTKNGII